MQQLDVTVVLLNFNQSRFFADAWKSVKRQKTVPKHIFVVDDGSRAADSQAVVQVIQQDAYREVRQFIENDNLGISKRLNALLPEIETTWFVVLAADDLFTTDALLHFSQNLNEDVDVVWGNLELMDEGGRELNYARPRDTWQGPVARSYSEPGFPFNDLLRYNNFIPGGMTLIRTSAVRQAGGWDDDITTEDFDLWLRISRSSRFRYIDKSVGRYRLVSGSKSRMDSQKVLDHARLLGKQTGVSPNIDERLAYLAAMRWAFTVFRTRNLPSTSLAEMAEQMKLSPWLLRAQLPRAIFIPTVGSIIARIRRLVS